MPAITKPKNVTWKEIFRRTLKEANEDDILGRSAQHQPNLPAVRVYRQSQS
jgi:hypothetical protein